MRRAVEEVGIVPAYSCSEVKPRDSKLGSPGPGTTWGTLRAATAGRVEALAKEPEMARSARALVRTMMMFFGDVSKDSGLSLDGEKESKS